MKLRVRFEGGVYPGACFFLVGLASYGCGSSGAVSGDAGSSDAPTNGQDSSDTGSGSLGDSSSGDSSSTTPLEDATVGVEAGSPDSGGNADSTTPDSATTRDSGGASADTGTPAPDDGGVAIDPSLLSKCSGSSPIACHFGGPVGNYDVTVELGGAAAGDTSVMAEISRQMLAPIATSAGETTKYTMVVNVRSPEGQPVADLGSKPSGLDLYFWGNNGASARLSGIGYAAATVPTPVVVYLATDSTGCDQTDTAYAGWGQWLPQYFTSPISIANYGNSGVDSPGFEGGSAYWGAIQPLLTSKDFLLIELGDNDKTDSASQITDALTAMVTGTKAKGATPILMTPANRATFSGTTVNPYTTGNVPTIMKQIGAAQNVTLLDLTTRTTEWEQQLGPNGWHPYFAYDNSTDTYDSTHFNQAGASIVAGFVRDLMQEANVPVLTNYMR